MARFAYVTGWRIPSEVFTLEWRQVDFQAGTVRLDAYTTKNEEPRVFPMTEVLRALLSERRQAADLLQRRGHVTPRVFFRVVRKRGGKGEPRPVPIVSLTKAWKAACVAAGCPRRIPHDLRRTAVRNLVRAGIPQRVAMAMTGHKTRSIFERYNIVSGSDLIDAAARLNAGGDKTGTIASSRAASDVRKLLERLEAQPGFEPGMEVLQIQRGRESCCLVLVFGPSSSPVFPRVRALSDYVWTTVPLLRHPAIATGVLRRTAEPTTAKRPGAALCESIAPLILKFGARCALAV